MNIEPLVKQLVEEYHNNGYFVTDELEESILRNENDLNDYHEAMLMRDDLSKEEMDFLGEFEEMMQSADIEGYEFL